MIMKKNYVRFAAARRLNELADILERETGQKFTTASVVKKADRMRIREIEKPPA